MNDVPDTPTITVKTLNNSYSKINEELGELADAITAIYSGEIKADSQEAVKEVLDVAVDLVAYINEMVVNCGLADLYEEADYKVYLNNATKICKDEEEARKTLDMYYKKGVVCDAYKHPDGHFIIKRCSDGKIMKGINYKSVEL
jgi:NTP pyrophosphatase (non-canonical NTP hydrolase)